MSFRTVAYWTALIVSSVFVLAVSAAIVVSYIDFQAHSESLDRPDRQAAIVAYGALLISAVTAFSGVFFGWRKDRREARELELRVRELEQQLEGPSD